MGLNENGYQNLNYNNDDMSDPAPPYDQFGSTAPIRPPITVQHQSYQTIPYIHTQVILVGGCPACRQVQFIIRIKFIYYYIIILFNVLI